MRKVALCISGTFHKRYGLTNLIKHNFDLFVDICNSKEFPEANFFTGGDSIMKDWVQVNKTVHEKERVENFTYDRVIYTTFGLYIVSIDFKPQYYNTLHLHYSELTPENFILYGESKCMVTYSDNLSFTFENLHSIAKKHNFNVYAWCSRNFITKSPSEKNYSNVALCLYGQPRHLYKAADTILRIPIKDVFIHMYEHTESYNEVSQSWRNFIRSDVYSPDEVRELYQPVRMLSNSPFIGNPTTSQLNSRQKVRDLFAEYVTITNTKYDYVICSRFDLLLYSVPEYINPEYIYACTRHAEHIIDDNFLILSQKNFLKIMNFKEIRSILDSLPYDKYNLEVILPTMIRYHGLEDKRVKTHELDYLLF